MAILSNSDLKHNNHSHENRRHYRDIEVQRALACPELEIINRRVYLDEGLTEPVQDQALGVH